MRCLKTGSQSGEPDVKKRPSHLDDFMIIVGGESGVG